jgi:hypothetical protein
MPTATFAAFRELLLDIGFEDRSVPGAAARFEHARTQTVILLRPYQEADPVAPAILVGYRRILDPKGLVPLDRFDELLRPPVSGERLPWLPRSGRPR